MKKWIFILMILLTSMVNSQQQNNNQIDTIKYFLDCSFCDLKYLNNEILFCKATPTKNEAHVLIIGEKINRQDTIKAYQFIFLGQGVFEGLKDSILYFYNKSESDENIKKGYTQIVKAGLMRYVAKTLLSKDISIKYSIGSKQDLVEDKWKSWIFSLNMGGFFNGQSSYKYNSLNSTISASKTTEEWKLFFRFSSYYSENIYTVDDEKILSLSRSNYFNSTVVKSIDDHWSYGGNLTLNSSIYSNLKLSSEIYPAIEFDVFPYSESTKKQLRLQYSLGAGYNSYQDSTIYDKIKENLFGQRLTAAFEIKEKWGSISAGFSASTYLHDLSKNSLNLNSNLNIRLFEGVSVYGSCYYSLIHNQLALSKVGASNDDILLQRKELSTQYSYSWSFGFSYTFGSTSNSVVNPRFGGGGSSISISM